MPTDTSPAPDAVLGDVADSASDAIRDALKLAELAQQAMEAAVILASRSGMSWEDIGVQMNLSKSAVHSRYAAAVKGCPAGGDGDAAAASRFADAWSGVENLLNAHQAKSSMRTALGMIGSNRGSVDHIKVIRGGDQDIGIAPLVWEPGADSVDDIAIRNSDGTMLMVQLKHQYDRKGKEDGPLGKVGTCASCGDVYVPNRSIWPPGTPTQCRHCRMRRKGLAVADRQMTTLETALANLLEVLHSEKAEQESRAEPDGRMSAIERRLAELEAQQLAALEAQQLALALLKAQQLKDT